MPTPSFCRVERRFSQPGNEPPTSSLRFGYLSIIIQQFKVILDHQAAISNLSGFRIMNLELVRLSKHYIGTLNIFLISPNCLFTTLTCPEPTINCSQENILKNSQSFQTSEYRPHVCFCIFETEGRHASAEAQEAVDHLARFMSSRERFHCR